MKKFLREKSSWEIVFKRGCLAQFGVGRVNVDIEKEDA